MPPIPAPPAKPVVPANSPLLNPNATLNGSALYQAAVALANAQEQPAITDLQNQVKTNDQQATGAANLAGQYFNQAAQYGQQGVTNANSIASGLNSQLAGIGNQTSQALTGIGNNELAAYRAYAPQTDPGNTLGAPGYSSLATELARQQGLSAQQQGAFQQFGASQGANFQGLANSELGTVGLRNSDALRGIFQANSIRNEPLESKIAGDIATQGALTATDLGKLRQQEITNSISAAGLGIKQQTANAATQNAQTSAKNAATTQQNDLANQAINQQKASTAASTAAFNNNPNAPGSAAWYKVQQATGSAFSNNPNAVGSPAWYRVQEANSKNGTTVKALTTNENNAWLLNLSKVESLIQQANQHKQPEAQTRSFLSSGQNPSKKSYDPVMIEAAYELLGYGSITQATANNMKNLGINLSAATYNGKPISITANYSPPPAPPLPPGINGPGTLPGPLPGGKPGNPLTG